jgi:hypothetical protein
VAAGMAPAAAALSVHLRRQPLHTPDGDLVGQDLEVTDVAAPADGVDDPIGALTRGLVTLLVEYPVAELVGDGLAMVGLTAPVVTGELPVPFDPTAAVIRTRVGADGERTGLAALARLAEQGHPIALDGIENSATARPALAVVRYAVLDVPADPTDDLRWDDVAAVAVAARDHGVELVARGAADPASRLRCTDLGVRLLLGPLPGPLPGDPAHGGRLQPRQACALRLLGELSDPLAEVEQIANVIKTDAALSFELLRVANSAAMGYPRSIGELRDAVVIVGMARLRAWVALVALAPSGGPSDALGTAVIQARMCELLAGRLHQGPPGAAFVVGLLDGVADALHLSVGDLLTALPKLSREVADALTGQDPVLHGLLRVARGYRGCDPAGTAPIGIPHPDATHAYLDALVWSAQTTRAVADRGSADRRD